MKKLSIIALFLILATLFSSCNITIEEKKDAAENNSIHESGSSSNTDSDSDVEIVQSGSVDFYRPRPVDEVKLTSSFNDGRYNYYYYYLGDIENFPLVKSEVATHTGNKFNYEQSLSSEKQQSIENSVARCVTTTVSRNWQNTVEIGVTFGNDKFFAVNAGFSTSWGVENSQSNSLETTHSVAESWANSTTNTFCFSLDKDDPHGCYRYVKYAKECKVFAVAIYDTQAEAKPERIDNFTFTYVTFVDETQSPYVVTEYSQNESFDSDKESDIATKLKFDENVVLGLDPNALMPNVIDIPVEKTQCKKTDEIYDTANKGNADHGRVHNTWELGHLQIVGCDSKEGKNTFSVSNPYAFSIKYVLEKDPSNPVDEKTIENMKENNVIDAVIFPSFKDAFICNDSSIEVKGMKLFGEKVGRGAYQVCVYRKGGIEDDPIVKTDFLSEKKSGDEIVLLNNVENIETIEKIKITIVYEIEDPGYSFFDGTVWTNWRSDYTFTFQ